MDRNYFEGRRDPVAIALEAFVANHAVAADPEGHEWRGGNGPVDVAWGSHAVDIKTGFIEHIVVSDGTRRECIGFMGNGRPAEAGDSVSHYAIVVPPDDNAKVTIESDGAVEISMAPPVRWYLVPREEVNAHFRQRRTRAGQPTGRNRYCPVAVAEQWQQAIS